MEATYVGAETCMGNGAISHGFKQEKNLQQENSVPGLHLHKSHPTLGQPGVLLETSVLTQLVNMHSLGNAVVLP